MGLSVRGGGGFGPAPLTLGDIERWENRRGRRLVEWEEAAIFRLDRAWLKSHAKRDDPDDLPEETGE
jgi:hypothetical protein